MPQRSKYWTLYAGAVGFLLAATCAGCAHSPSAAETRRPAALADRTETQPHVFPGATLLAERRRRLEQVLIPLDRIELRARATASTQLFEGTVYQRLERLPAQVTAAQAWTAYRSALALEGYTTQFACFDNEECGADFGAFVALSGSVVPTDFGPIASLDHGVALVGRREDTHGQQYWLVYIQPQGSGTVDLFQLLLSTPRPPQPPSSNPAPPRTALPVGQIIEASGTLVASAAVSEISFSHDSAELGQDARASLAVIAQHIGRIEAVMR